MTKALGEKLIVHANKMDSDTRYICVRGGNVLGSSGSVIPLFKQQISENNHILITDKRMTRYFITPQKAIKTLLKAAEVGRGGEIFIMHMEACKILDLADVLIKHYGNENTKIKEIGVRTGEKIHEVLIAKNEMDAAKIYDEDLILISSTAPLNVNSLRQSSLIHTSNNLMTKQEIHELLTEGGLLT